jgi:Mg-chelatase subunit ChlD
MQSWAMKRRLIYGFGFLLTLALIGFAIYYTQVDRTTSCTDGKKNGDESGIDCGGSCKNICKSEVLSPIVLWSKAFNISQNVYSVAALVENPNISSSNSNAKYVFKVYDAKNSLLGTREGEIFIPKNKKFLIFEPGFNFVNSVPKRVELEFTSFSEWQKDNAVEPDLTIDYSPLQSTSTSPYIEGTVTNNSLFDIGKVELSTLVADGRENVVAVSRTFIDRLRKGESQKFVFTWPKPFDLGVESCEIPADVIVALDRSGSMRSEGNNPPEPFTTVKNVAKSFAENLMGADSVSVVSFGNTGVVESNLSSNINSASGAIDKLILATTSEQTNIKEGLERAKEELVGERANPEAKKIIVLLTDGLPTEPRAAGQPNYPKLSAENVAEELRQLGIIVYTIGLGAGVNESFLKNISLDNSHYFFAPNKTTLSSIYNQISTSLCQKKPNAIHVIYKVYNKEY